MATRLRLDFQSRLGLDGNEFEVLSFGHKTANAALRKGRSIIREIATTKSDLQGMLSRLSVASLPDLTEFPTPSDQKDDSAAWWIEVAGAHPAAVA